MSRYQLLKMLRLSVLMLAFSMHAEAAENGAAEPQTTTTTGSPSERKPADQPTVPDRPAAQADRPSGSSTTQKTQSGEIFKPSEEISEDFAVPFPVDI